MNLFRFLKSTKGTIKPLNALLISGAAGVVFAYTVNTAANKQIAAERAVRSLTSIGATAPQEGLHRQGGLLTSINVRDGRNELATAQERAAMKGSSPLDRYEANQRALHNMDASLGRAAEFADGEGGLNTGNRNAVQSADRFVVGNPNAGVVGDNVANAYAPQGAADSNSTGGSQPQLAKASMTRATGNAFGATPGAVSGGISAQGSSYAGGEGPARLSGAMPGGTNIVSQRAGAGLGAGNNTASFGKDRNARVTRGRHGRSEANELKDIVKKSADAAGNVSRDSANEGGRAFMANAANSGGVQVEGAGENTATASSADLAAATNRKLKAIGNKLSEVENKQEERNKAHRRLIAQLIATALGSIAAMIVGAKILKHLDDRIRDLGSTATPYTAALIAGLKATRLAYAIAMVAAIGAVNAFLFVRAKQFASNYGAYGGTTVATIAQFVAPLMVAAAVQTAITPTWKDFISKAWKGFKSMAKSAAMSVFMPKIG